jgi:hypothetical protein
MKGSMGNFQVKKLQEGGEKGIPWYDFKND